LLNTMRPAGEALPRRVLSFFGLKQRKLLHRSQVEDLLDNLLHLLRTFCRLNLWMTPRPLNPVRKCNHVSSVRVFLQFAHP